MTQSEVADDVIWRERACELPNILPPVGLRLDSTSAPTNERVNLPWSDEGIMASAKTELHDVLRVMSDMLPVARGLLLLTIGDATPLIYKAA